MKLLCELQIIFAWVDKVNKKQMSRVLVFGDNNVDQLKRLLFGPVFHLESHNGLTTEQVVSTMMWELEAMLNEDEKYDSVVIILGANDLSMKETTEYNLRKINELVCRYTRKCLFVDLHCAPIQTQLPTIPVNLHPDLHFETNGIRLNPRGARLVATNIRWMLMK